MLTRGFPMVDLSSTVIVFVIFIAFAAAISGVIMLELFTQVRRKSIRELLKGAENSVVFLFEDEDLVDATERAKQMLTACSKGTSSWRRFCTVLEPRFPDLSQSVSNLAEEGELTFASQQQGDETEVRAEWWNGIARIEIVEDPEADASISVDPHSLNAINSELEILRQTAEMSPYLVWQQTGQGEITWANTAYLEIARRLSGENEKPVLTWPPERVFPTVSLAQGTPEERAHRVSLKFPDAENQRWYEIYSTTIGAESLHFANNVDNVIRAETSLRDFVQTLTKTFAHLPTGLAIFDKRRQLALFNPALTDLTGLTPMFLSLRPTLFSFLDKLRESHVIPEPKDYKSWRQQMTDLEAAAADGTYSETWALPSGQTYRVTGRPHPDGAVALLFEDISKEVSLTRRFRAELEAGQAVLDSFSEAIVVFASNGQLTMSNSAFSDFWGMDPGSILGEFNINDALAFWQEKCDPNPVWEQIRSFIRKANPRNEVRVTTRIKDGRILPLRITPLSGGGSLIAFTPPKRIDESIAPEAMQETPKERPLFTIKA